MPGTQFHTLSHFSQILASVPEGAEAADLIQAELKDRGGIGKIDKVTPELIAALSRSVPILERAIATPSETALQAYEGLKRIAVLTSTSQTMNAILDASTLDRARDLGRPRVESPAVRYLERIVFPAGDKNEEGRSGPVFFRDGAVVHWNQWDAMLEMLSAHFGSEVTRKSLDELYTLPQKEYRIAAVDMRKDKLGNLRVIGEIRQEQERVGYFSMSIPAVPPRGTPWAVKVEAITIIHKRVGIASQLLARLALFLHERGVHTMKADAKEEAGLFCVFNGFRLDKSLYEDIVNEFIKEMERTDVEIAREAIVRLLDRDANLAELATFEWKRRRIGREFLQTLFTQKYLPVRFELSADKQSWLRLLSNLHRGGGDERLAPLEWASLSPATRQLLYSGVLFVGGNVPHFMSSDRDHAIHLVERLNNWATMISMMMDFPQSMWSRMPEERRREFDDKRAAIQAVLEMIAADPASSLFSHFCDLMSPGHDGVTGDSGTNRAFFIAGTVLNAAGKGWLKIPSHFEQILTELVSRVY